MKQEHVCIKGRWCKCVPQGKKKQDFTSFWTNFRDFFLCNSKHQVSPAASSLLQADTDNVNQNTQSDVSITREGTDKINPFMKTRLSTVWIIQCSKKKFSMIHRSVGPHSSYQSAQSCTLAAPSGRKMGQHVKTAGKLKTASVVDCKVITDRVSQRTYSVFVSADAAERLLCFRLRWTHFNIKILLKQLDLP